MRTQRLRSTLEEATMAVSDARLRQVYEQAREHWGEETAEALMELFVPAGQNMATQADIDAAVVALCARMDGLDARIDGIDARMVGLATKEYVLRMLLIALTPLYLGMLRPSLGVAGPYFIG